jgi:hypothetical protein
LAPWKKWLLFHNGDNPIHMLCMFLPLYFVDQNIVKEHQ